MSIVLALLLDGLDLHHSVLQLDCERNSSGIAIPSSFVHNMAFYISSLLIVLMHNKFWLESRHEVEFGGLSLIILVSCILCWQRQQRASPTLTKSNKQDAMGRFFLYL